MAAHRRDSISGSPSRCSPLKQGPSHHAGLSTRTCTHNTKHISHHTGWNLLGSQQLLLLLIFLTCCSLASASPTIYIEDELVEVEVRTAAPEPLRSTYDRLARSGTILVDPNPPPVANNWQQDQQDLAPDDLKRRAAEVESSSTSSISSTTTKKASSTSTLAPSSTSSGAAAAESTAAIQLPTPFDMGFNNNITDDCNSFMQSMLSNATFQTCLPFSLLLQNSNSFFKTSKSLVRITQLLDYTCAASVTKCSATMAAFASNITTTSACASDLASENPLIQQALLGLKAYKPLYTASCLRNPSTSAYCFADAITNASNPTDSYIYFLPLNISLVGGSQPTCDACLKNTMAVFEAASADRTQPLVNTYSSAAQQINVNCGPSFVNTSLAEAITSSAPAASHPGSTMGMVALLAVLVTWIL